MELFLWTWNSIREEFKITKQDAIALWGKGLLSYDPESIEEIDRTKLVELQFLVDLCLRSGLSDAYVYVMLGNLKRPYAYFLGEIYWDFKEKCWKSFEDKAGEFYENWLDDEFFEIASDTISESDEIEDLLSLKKKLEERIEELKEQDD